MTKPDLDLDHLQQWTGKEAFAEDFVAPRQAQLLAATLGWRNSALREGASLPPLWHWIYFLEGLPPAELGRDGHPARGSFLPPVPLENRMWAGGDVQFHRPLVLGRPAAKRSRIQSVVHKRGRSGDLVFVSVLHEISQEGVVAVSEVHDIVYKDRAPNDAKSEAKREGGSVPAAQHTRAFKPDSTMLFRYSALTFNGHRIHYDKDYCREVEGYADLVIHGPLNATVLAMFAEEAAGKRLRRFRYRGLQPSLLGSQLTAHAAQSQADEMLVWMGLADGAISMRAEASFHPEDKRQFHEST
jgi:3-methylfumaryl-CoA hydratase